MSDRYRGRTTRQRNVADKVAREWAERRAAAEVTEAQVDLDRASAEAEVELLDPGARPAVEGDAAKARRPARPVTAARGGDRAGATRGAGRRVPDLAALPRLLHETGSFGSLRERLGPVAEPGMHGRHVGLTTVPHGAKSFLAASLALAPAGERICWVARDAEIGDRVAEELGAWLGDPSLVAVLEPRTSLAYERSELVPDETAARVAALAAWRAGSAKVLVASVQALVQATLAPSDLPTEVRVLKPATRIGQGALLAELLDRGYTPVLEVAGRREFARRGGIVDVFPPSASLPVRIEFFGDEIDSLRAFDPTDQRSVGTVKELALLPATEFLLPAGGADEIRARLGRLASKLPERLALDLARFAGEATSPERPAAPTEGRALAAGDAAEVWSRVVAPSTGLDHLDHSTLFVLDEPGDLAEAAEFLWRQAEERHRELVEGGDLPKDWPVSYLPPRDWKARLHGARTLELTWQSDAQEAAGMAFASKGLTSGDLFGWREPVLPPGRTERLVDGVEHWLGERRRVVLASDQAPRLAELLGEAGHPVGIVSRITEAPPPGAIALIERSLNGGFEGGPDGLAVVTDRELFGSVRVRRPKAMRRVVPRDILERLTPGDMVVHIDHGIARYEQMLRRGDPGEERDYLELSFAAGDRIFVPVEQINRVSRYSGGEHPPLSRLGGTDWLRTKQRVAQGGQRPRRGAARAVREARGRAGLPVLARLAVADGDGGVVPVRGDARPAPGRRRGQDRHGGAPADGPAGGRRRRVRQDRGRAAGRVQGDAGREAGRGPRADDRARRAALLDVQPAVRGVPTHGEAAVAVRVGEGAGRRPCAGSPPGRSTSSSAPTGCCPRTWRSRTSAWSWSTRSSGSGSRRRSG